MVYEKERRITEGTIKSKCLMYLDSSLVLGRCACNGPFFCGRKCDETYKRSDDPGSMPDDAGI